MAILYVFKIVDPKKVNVFPPTVMTSSWFNELMDYFATNSIQSRDGTTICTIFPDASALNFWVSTYKLTDADLLADIELWKSAHNVVYSHQYFELDTHSENYSSIF